MEHKLRCNALKCRRELADRALVTTCSHIFCTDCASRLGLADPSGRREHRNTCPACNTLLTNPDDAVITQLHPSEDYKTSVLSGLSPNVIIECASRAISFWAYQITQEVVYQEYLGKTLTEKYSDLSVHLDKVINEANSQIGTMQNKISALTLEQEKLLQKKEELSVAFKEKNRKLLQTQELYDKLKRKAMMGQMQDAAEDAVDSSLHAAAVTAAGSEPTRQWAGEFNPAVYQEPGTPYHSSRYAVGDGGRVGNMYSNQGLNLAYGGQWPRTIGAQSNVPLTPSTHRQRMGEPFGIGLTNVPGLVTATPRSPRPPVNMRMPLGDISHTPRNAGRFHGVGLSSGLKVSHGGGNFTDFGVPSTRPQVIQRPTPTASSFGGRGTSR